MLIICYNIDVGKLRLLFLGMEQGFSSTTAKQYDDSVTNLKKARKKIKLKAQKFLIRKLIKKCRIEK